MYLQFIRAMHRCLARFYYFLRIGHRVREIRISHPKKSNRVFPFFFFSKLNRNQCHIHLLGKSKTAHGAWYTAFVLYLDYNLTNLSNNQCLKIVAASSIGIHWKKIILNKFNAKSIGIHWKKIILNKFYAKIYIYQKYISAFDLLKIIAIHVLMCMSCFFCNQRCDKKDEKTYSNTLSYRCNYRHECSTCIG